MKVIRIMCDHFWQNICDLSCEKRPQLKHFKNAFYTYSFYMQYYHIGVDNESKSRVHDNILCSVI